MNVMTALTNLGFDGFCGTNGRHLILLHCVVFFFVRECKNRGADA